MRREEKAKWNIAVTILSQLVTLACGIVIPGIMIKAFGSEAYGATTSIAQFLAYITLLEGGIGGVARAAFYKPLANKDSDELSEIMQEVQSFFTKVAYVFAVYVIVLAVCYPYIANNNSFEWIFTFSLVLVISISTFAQYFFGIANAIFLQADQKTYITNAISTLTTILNTVAIVVMVYLHCDIILVKLASSIVFVLRPLLMWLYVRRNYDLKKVSRKTNHLKQKWEGLGQHIAYFFHLNTGVALLTIAVDLATVAVYSVYNMIISHMQNLTASFSAGMEALFGDLIAKEENDALRRIFEFYDTLISFMSLILIGTTAALLLPFVRIYTAGVTDADYIQPLFGFLFILASFLYCVRLPYNSVVIAAGHFRQTRAAAYGEAIINIVISLSCVFKFGLIGVAIGTVIATGFRFIYYAVYLTDNILHKPLRYTVKRTIINFGTFIVIYICGTIISDRICPANYLQWCVCAVITVICSILVSVAVYYIFYRENLKTVLRKLGKRGLKK